MAVSGRGTIPEEQHTLQRWNLRAGFLVIFSWISVFSVTDQGQRRQPWSGRPAAGEESG